MDEPRNELLTVKAAAALLKVSPYTVYRWIGEGRLASVRFSPRVIRIRRSDLEEVVEISDARRGPASRELGAVREVAVAGYRPGNKSNDKEVIDVEEELREVRRLVEHFRELRKRPRSPNDPPKGSWEALRRHVGVISKEDGEELWRVIKEDRERSRDEPVKWPIFSTRRRSASS